MGQDVRYSQYFNNGLTVNPALTGLGIDYLRSTLSYRHQSAGPANPFTTKGFMVDKKVGKVGLGFMINSNGAGDASIKTLNFSGSFSYSLNFGYKGRNTISAGTQVGAISRSINPSKLTFDNQYQQDVGYDPNLSSGEVFETKNTIRPVVNAGLYWKSNPVKNRIRSCLMLDTVCLTSTGPITPFSGLRAKQIFDTI